MSKDALRAHYRKLRLQFALNADEIARQACAHLVKQTVFHESKHIAIYLNLPHEFATRPLIQTIWQQQKSCYVPMLSANGVLQFVLYESHTPLKTNRFHIQEPSEPKQIVEAAALDLVILPMLAFDKHGHRLGTGGGWYDKTFHFLKPSMTPPPFLLGLAYAFQEAEAIPPDPWDVSLHGYLTEKEFRIVEV